MPRAARPRVERFRTCNFWPWEVRNFQPCSSSGENPGETHQNTPLTLLLTKDYRNRHSRSDHPGSRPDPTLSAKSPLPAAARYFLLQPHVSFVREFFASRALRARTPGKSGPLVNRSGKSELGGEQIGRKLCLCADWYVRFLRLHCTIMPEVLEDLPCPEDHLVTQPVLVCALHDGLDRAVASCGQPAQCVGERVRLQPQQLTLVRLDQRESKPVPRTVQSVSGAPSTGPTGSWAACERFRNKTGRARRGDRRARWRPSTAARWRSGRGSRRRWPSTGTSTSCTCSAASAASACGRPPVARARARSGLDGARKARC